MARKPRTRQASVIDSTRVELGPSISAALSERPGPAHVPANLRIWLDLLRWRDVLTAIIRLLRWHRLDFMMQHQQQTNWCWAAVATSVALYYDPASTWTQCAVANGELGRTDCCGTGASGPCNVYGYLASSLTRVGHLDHWAAGTATFAQVGTEIDAGRPLGVRTAWSGGGAHFLAIVGYRLIFDMLAVDDPWYGKSDVSYSAFSTNYQGSGTWTHCYYTEP